MFFDGWQGLLRVAIISPLVYFALLIVLRISGKRTLSKFNAFDLVVTVALGSTFATIILSEDVALAEGILALALLAGLQFMVSWLSVRSSHVEELVKAEPSLLVYQQRYLRDVMQTARITEAEVLAALRSKGIPMEEAEAVVLETDGSISIVKKAPEGGESRLLSGLNPDPKDLEQQSKL